MSPLRAGHSHQVPRRHPRTALGTIVVLAGCHVLRALAPPHLETQPPLLDEGASAYDEDRGDEDRGREGKDGEETGGSGPGNR
ncbi:hypothetical protein [Streptomyces sp. NPDC053427]|uniref:hypothetical protein n=1 Tax=Streptomyces sp. NPDC053427 TaxID=3365701 RepID=UPI0037D86940